MNFLRLNDYLLSVLFEDDEIVAIDKPYGINSHTNDSKSDHGEFIQDGLIEIYEKQLKKRLSIVHRLDQTTTGVIVFAKTPAAAKKYADFFFQRQVKKTYWFVTESRSGEIQFFRDDAILHKGKELQAQTQMSLLNRSSRFELWQANPLTGRNHQIRIHAQAAGISILGDEKYGGSEFPFLCLHNHKIEFPNGVILFSQPPKYFKDLHFLENPILAKAFFEEDRRIRLFSLFSKQQNEMQDQCFRLIHNKNDSQDLGLTIDHFGKNLVLSCYQEKWSESDQKTFSSFVQFWSKPMIVRLMHNRGKDPLNKSQFVIGQQHQVSSEIQPVEASWVAKENGIKYEMRSDSGQSFGLFLDQRLQRNWVLNHSQDRAVLNLFSYTGGFSVAAALGGARQVTSVDTSKAVLNWSKRNFELNHLDPQKHQFLYRDSLEFLSQISRKKGKFDLIICDPPSFSRGEKGVFKIDEQLEMLLKGCLECLGEEGDLLFSTNFEGFFIDDIRKAIIATQKKLGILHLEISCIQSGLDFELPGKKPILKSFLIRKTRSLPVVEETSFPQEAGDFDED